MPLYLSRIEEYLRQEIVDPRHLNRALRQTSHVLARMPDAWPGPANEVDPDTAATAIVRATGRPVAKVSLVSQSATIPAQPWLPPVKAKAAFNTIITDLVAPAFETAALVKQTVQFRTKRHADKLLIALPPLAPSDEAWPQSLAVFCRAQVLCHYLLLYCVGEEAYAEEKFGPLIALLAHAAPLGPLKGELDHWLVQVA